MPLVDVVLCMPDQLLVFLAAIIATRCCGMLATRHCRHSTGISVHFSSRAWRSSSRFWGGLSILVIAWHNSYQICSMGFSLAILQAPPSWWRCPAKGNQGLPTHGDLWRYHLDSGNYPWNATWQMALRCFAKCSCRAHRWGICRGTQNAIWHHCEKLPWRVLSHQQVAPYKPDTFAGGVHQVNDIPLARHLLGKIGMLPMGHCQVLPPLCPLQSEMTVNRGFLAGL